MTDRVMKARGRALAVEMNAAMGGRPIGSYTSADPIVEMRERQHDELLIEIATRHLERALKASTTQGVSVSQEQVREKD